VRAVDDARVTNRVAVTAKGGLSGNDVAMMSRASKCNQSYVVCTFSSLFRMDEAADL